MALVDIIANRGSAFQDAYYKSSTNRRARESHDLRQMMGQQTIQQNQMKLQAQQKQVKIMEARQKAIQDYSGDKKGMVDALFSEGDIEGAANVVQFEQGMQNLSKSQQDEMQRNLDNMSSAALESSGSVMEAFARNPQEGMQASMQEADRLTQQFPQMRERMPDFKTMNPQETKTWWANKYNRSSKNREFKEKQRAASVSESRLEASARELERHHKAMEKTADLKVEAAKLKAGKSGSFKSSDGRAIYSMSVGYHGGMFDSDGNIKMLDPKKSQDVQDLSALAAILYQRNKVNTHNEAISMAAEQLDMQSTETPTETKKPADQGKFTDENLQFTAKKHGITVEELKEKLGIK